MIFKKNPEKERTKLEHRVSKMATADLLAWSEQAMFGIGRSLSSYQRQANNADIDEALMGAEALYVVVKELKARR